MNRLGINKTVLGSVLALTVVLTGLLATPAAATSRTMLTETQVKKALLTLPQITSISGAAGPVTSAGVTCHAAPYYAGNVEYCYYEMMRSDAAYAGGKPSPSHVDIISFSNAKLPIAYLKEMKAGGGPTAITLTATPTLIVKYDPKASISTSADAGGQPVLSTGPTVSVYQRKGINVVYTVCADPKATTSTQLAICAKKLATAQLARLK
ncbi:MAG: hypothetical protein WCP95_04180 [Actinomycetes bacterium]